MVVACDGYSPITVYDASPSKAPASGRQAKGTWLLSWSCLTPPCPPSPHPPPSTTALPLRSATTLPQRKLSKTASAAFSCPAAQRTAPPSRPVSCSARSCPTSARRPCATARTSGCLALRRRRRRRGLVWMRTARSVSLRVMEIRRTSARPERVSMLLHSPRQRAMPFPV